MPGKGRGHHANESARVQTEKERREAKKKEVKEGGRCSEATVRCTCAKGCAKQ